MASSTSHPPTTPSTPKPNRRRQNRSSEEEAYAGPAEILAALPISPPATEVNVNVTPSPTFRKRVRRMGGSPEDSPPNHLDQGWKELQRIGMPSLVSLPADSAAISSKHPLAQQWNRSETRTISDILHQHHMGAMSMSVTHRASYLDRQLSDQWPVTLLIITKGAVQQHSDRCWLACQQIRTWLDTHAMADIWLEMCDEDAIRLMRSFPVHPLDRAVKMWPRLEGPIIDALRSTDCLAMTLVRRGRETLGSWPSLTQETVVDQRHITVFVTIPEGSSIDWASVRDKIVNILEEADVLDVAVEIHRGRLWPAMVHSGTFLDENDWKKPAKGGASIGPVFEPESATTWLSSPLSLSSSTLGGFVEVCWEDGSWHTYALTCYHAAFPSTRPHHHFPVDDNGWSTWYLPLPGRTLFLIKGLPFFL